MKNKIFRIACIGSREISDQTRIALEQIGEQIAVRGWEIASGNALGSDYAYAMGANNIDPTLVHLYLPWGTYNVDQLIIGNKCHLDIPKHWEKVARQFHPRYDSLTQGAKKMMDRNAGIILESHATLAVLNPNKIGGGGTGHGWRISASLKRPMIDLTRCGSGTPSLSEIIAGLEAVAKNFEENENPVDESKKSDRM